MKTDKLFSQIIQKKSSILFYPSCGCDNIIPELFDLPYDVFILSDYGRFCCDPKFIKFIKNPMVDRSNYEILRDHYSPLSTTELLVFWDCFRARLPRQSYSDLDESRLVIKFVGKDLIYFSIGRKQVFLLLCDNNIALAYLNNLGLKISCFAGTNDGCQEGGNYECVNSENWLRRVFELMHPEGIVYITDHIGNVYDTMQGSFETLFPNYKITRIDQKLWLADHRIQKMPFNPMFTKYEDLYLHLVSNR